MIEIIPAIIPKSFIELKSEMSRVCGVVANVQIDIMDGSYAVGRTWPYQSNKPDADFQNIITEKEGFPFWEDLGFEVDMMTKNPENKLNDWIMAGVEALIIHIETTKEIGKIIEKCRGANVKIGLALKPSTPIDLLEQWISKIDFVQFMGNDSIGRHGVELDPVVFEKIKDLRKENPIIPIAVDIGVNFETAPLLIEAGATKLVSGSTIFESLDVQEAISELKGSL